MNLDQNDNKMRVDKQQLIVSQPKFFWHVLIGVENVSAPEKLSNRFQSSGDHRDQTDLIFFIQWPLESYQVTQKSFRVTEVSLIYDTI